MAGIGGGAVETLLGRAPVSALAFRFGDSRLRVLAYHGVPDPQAFERQLVWLTRRCTIVGQRQIVDALDGAALPDRPVWLTFDDGLATAAAQGLEQLVRHGATATIFVNPGLIEAGVAQWWRVIEAVDGPAAVSRLKTRPDAERRRAVEHAAERLSAEEVGLLAAEIADRPALERWLDAGMSIGNHTWDHPCLDRCDPVTIRRQVADAHTWLLAQGWMSRDEAVFAYPNGDWTSEAERMLDDLGYRIGLLFDHRTTDLRQPLRLSRLRIDASADTTRLAAIASGSHSAAFHLGRRLGARW